MKDFFEHIDDYLGHRLSAADNTLFESELSSNKALQKAIDNHDIATLMMDQLVEDDIRSVIENEQTNTNHLTTEQKKNYKVGFTLVAILISMALVALLYNKMTKETPQQLYAEFYSEFIDKRDTRGNISLQDPLSQCDHAHSLIDQGTMLEAQDLFEQILKEGPETCIEKAEWYLALQYLLAPNAVNRDEMLDRILKNKDHSYFAKAQALKDRL